MLSYEDFKILCFDQLPSKGCSREYDHTLANCLVQSNIGFIYDHIVIYWPIIQFKMSHRLSTIVLCEPYLQIFDDHNRLITCITGSQ
jgi:hypothetical protein